VARFSPGRTHEFGRQRFVVEGMLNLARRVLRFVSVIGTALALLSAPALRASEAGSESEEAPAPLEIVISKETQQMAVYVDGELRHAFVVSTGGPRERTPSGDFRVLSMHRMAYAPKYDNAPMPHSIFFTRHGHAIHGTGHLRTLGRPVSHGCVRLKPEEAELLYALVQLIGPRNTIVRVM
jgi:lipoprotein-anchoring transpeptidase ErfK/SrfK